MLRGFGMLLILVGHAWGNLIPWASPFWENSGLNSFFHNFREASGAGVDLFFAISGFVIVRDLHPKLTNSANHRTFINISLAFWIRRIWRIFPAAWLWLGIIILVSVFYNKSGVFHTPKANLNGAIAGIFQYYNYHFALCYRHYDCGASFYYWTLSLEEQFYLLLPFSIFLLRKWFPHILACLIIFQLSYPNRSIMMELFRTDALLLGILIALWSVKPGYRQFESRFLGNFRWARILILILFFSNMILDTRIFGGRLAPFSLGIFAAICGMLVLIGSYDKNYLLASGRLKNLLMWLGSRSCSLYLVHIPAYYLTQEIWFRNAAKGYEVSYTLPFVLSGIAAVFIVGELNYRFLEVPTRRKGTEVSTRFLQRRMPQQPIDRHAAGSGL